jgi:sugar lactone lactonase YvrE
LIKKYTKKKPEILLMMNSPSASATWSTQGVVVAGGNGCGNALNQLAAPCYIFIDASDAIYIADANNNRIVKWKKDAAEGTVVASDQLNGPNYIIVDKQGTMFIRDGMETYRVTRWPKGAQLGEVIYSSTISPDALAFDENEEYLLISLGAENRVVKYNKNNGEEIEVVAGGNGERRSLKQLYLRE